MIELEKTYLARSLPEGLQTCKSKEVIDIYIPASQEHPNLRIRKNGENYEMTKKFPVEEGDASRQHEQTIVLREDEFAVLKNLPGKKVRKVRYYYPYQNKVAEVEIFQDDLYGLVLVEVEFDSVEEKEGFAMPDFCVAEVTQEDFVAGGKICGKSYADIEEKLGYYQYVALYI